MARSKDGYKSYQAGDPIHIVVTQDFVGDANRFFTYCREKGYNPSQIIRQAMVDWVNREERPSDDVKPEPLPGESFDEKIMNLVKEKRTTRNKMSLKSVKEILESEK